MTYISQQPNRRGVIPQNTASLNCCTQNKINLISNQDGMENQLEQKLLEEDFHNGDFRYNLEMEVEQQIKQIIHTQLSIAQRKRLYGNVIMDWGLVRLALEQYLVPSLITLITQLMKEKEENIRELREENRRLQAQINQMSFTNNPLRDQKIIELFKEGLSTAEIARTVGMSRQGLVKAFRRLQLDGNSVATGQVSP